MQQTKRKAKYNWWVGKGWQKVVVTIDKKEIMSRFIDHVKIIKRPIYVKRIQNTKFNSLKANLKCDKTLIQVDYSDNYGNKDQRQI